MKIALICTDNESLSFGMRSISAALRAHGYPCRLIFAETDEKTYSTSTLEEIARLSHDYDVIGFSCMAQGSNKTKQALEYLKPLDKTTVWGGIHASLNPDECADWADYICLGEGEGMIVEFMERVTNFIDCRDLQNAAYKENGTLVKNDLRPLISNLDELPLPDFSFEDEYHLTIDGFKQVFSLSNVERHGQIPFTSSRGCAFYCTYCCNIKLKELYTGKDHYVRRMSVARLIEHSQILRKIFPNGKYFYFIDEDFAARPSSELAELAERFPKEVGLPYECLAHPSRITEKNIDYLVRSGIYRVRIGIESGSERTKREIYRRHVSNQAVNRATEILSKTPQIAPVYFFIFANPYEEREDLLATLKLIQQLPYGASIQAFELIFFPGSTLYERAVADGLIEGSFDSGHVISYYGGLHFVEYPWKKKNLYLNGLIFLSGGLCTRTRIGIIPRFIFTLLINPRIVSFNERHTFAIRFMIVFKEIIYKIRFRTVHLIKRVIKDPIAIYNLSYYLKNKFSLRVKSPETSEIV